ncbi:MAG: succinylglutamate desuccinylase/aspartoacylase family protein [Pararhizobium sp.]
MEARVKQDVIVIPGDTPEVSWRVPVLEFAGTQAGSAPKVYLQAALHANECPGVATLHRLCARLRAADAAGAIRGDITIVPQANPIGAAQSHFGEMQGRFDLGSRGNYNRDFPLIPASARNDLLVDLDRLTAPERLKRELLHRALGADLVLDLHCDDESLPYAYIDSAFWPEASDLASALKMDAVFLSDGESSAFEEAVSYAWKQEEGGKGVSLPGRLSVTVELRGRRDVGPDVAARDADGLWAFLEARGVVDGGSPALQPYGGPAFALDTIEMIKAPAPGTILFHRDIGDRVEAGDLLAVLVPRPGFPEDDVEVRAPQAGLVVTRSSARFARRRDDLMKIGCAEITRAGRRAGTLED